MKIYLACGLTHVPRSIFDHYVRVIHDLATALKEIAGVEDVKYALVDSDPQLSEKPAQDRAKLCYAWDRKMVENADLVIAEGSFPSTGLGIELQIADNDGTPIILLVGDYEINKVDSPHYQNPDATEHELQVGEGLISLMALGVPSIAKTIRYGIGENVRPAASDAVKVFLKD